MSKRKKKPILSEDYKEYRRSRKFEDSYDRRAFFEIVKHLAGPIIEATEDDGRERGFAIHKEGRGRFVKGEECLGNECSVRIERPEGQPFGSFHTHPEEGRILQYDSLIPSSGDIVSGMLDGVIWKCIGNSTGIRCFKLFQKAILSDYRIDHLRKIRSGDVDLNENPMTDNERKFYGYKWREYVSEIKQLAGIKRGKISDKDVEGCIDPSYETEHDNPLPLEVSLLSKKKRKTACKILERLGCLFGGEVFNWVGRCEGTLPHLEYLTDLTEAFQDKK